LAKDALRSRIGNRSLSCSTEAPANAVVFVATCTTSSGYDLARVSAWCRDQGLGRTDPLPRPRSRHANGLALGGIAGVGQLQLLQPFFGLALAGLLLDEPIAWTMIAVTGLVVLCVAGAKRFA